MTVQKDVTGTSGPRTFSEDLAFLREHTEVILLSDPKRALVAVTPAWQGRVMTTTAEHDRGQSFGWINRGVITSSKGKPPGNFCGGEDRLQLAPEGGPQSISEALYARPLRLVRKTKQSVAFETEFPATNSAGNSFQVGIRREVRVLEPKETLPELDVPPSHAVSVVAFETRNALVNLGRQPWRKDTGLLSIWIRGMFTPPSPATTMIVPIKAGSDLELGPKMTSNYFGPIPSERLRVTENLIYLRGDGQFRSKIAINPRRSRRILASYDEHRRVLTLVQFSQSDDLVDYLNPVGDGQDDPYGGAVASSYNDGPVSPGDKSLGPYYQMESFSPAVALQPGASIEHMQRTLHLTGIDRELDRIMRVLLGVRLEHVKSALGGGVIARAF
jgi:hypothetical protein